MPGGERSETTSRSRGGGAVLGGALPCLYSSSQSTCESEATTNMKERTSAVKIGTNNNVSCASRRHPREDSRRDVSFVTHAFVDPLVSEVTTCVIHITIKQVHVFLLALTYTVQ